MADVSKLRLDNVTYDIKDDNARKYLVMVNEEPVSATKMVVTSSSDAIEFATTDEVINSISAEVSARNTAIQNAVNSEASARQAAINEETTARTNAITNAVGDEAGVRATADTALSNRIDSLQGAVGSPLVAATKSAMTNTSKIYVYTGSESGMTSGNWYYHNGSAWVSGGVYNATAVNTDTTLTLSGRAADSKAVGDRICDLKKTVTSSNYSTKLPNLNNAPIGSIYLLNFAASGNKPANLPNSNIDYSMAMLFTLGDSPYCEQYLYNEGVLYKRLYAASSGTWQSWSNNVFLLNGVKNSMVEIITISNYASSLPDCDNAAANSIKILNFAASGNKPANVPDSSIEYSMSLLLTYASTAFSYKVQYCIDKSFMYQRVYNGNAWGDWRPFDKPKYIVANSSNLISILKTYNDSGVDILLDNGIYDVYQMYIDYYGNDFWTNYEGYDGVADNFYKGLFVQNVNLIGKSNTVFRFSGVTTNAIRQYFSLIATAGRTKIDSIVMDVGNQKLRYAIHDDYDPTDGKWGVNIEYHNIVFRGTPDSNGLIGAGFRNGGNYKIDNCVFLDNSNPYDISYHSHVTGSIPSRITISNCYGSQVCSFAYYGSGTEANTCIVNNCQFKEISKRAISGATIDNMNVIKYMCVETGS